MMAHTASLASVPTSSGHEVFSTVTSAGEEVVIVVLVVVVVVSSVAGNASDKGMVREVVVADSVGVNWTRGAAWGAGETGKGATWADDRRTDGDPVEIHTPRATGAAVGGPVVVRGSMISTVAVMIMRGGSVGDGTGAGMRTTGVSVGAGVAKLKGGGMAGVPASSAGVVSANGPAPLSEVESPVEEEEVRVEPSVEEPALVESPAEESVPVEPSVEEPALVESPAEESMSVESPVDVSAPAAATFVLVAPASADTTFVTTEPSVEACFDRRPFRIPSPPPTIAIPSAIKPRTRKHLLPQQRPDRPYLLAP